jgi:hypothetical protein
MMTIVTHVTLKEGRNRSGTQERVAASQGSAQ